MENPTQPPETRTVQRSELRRRPKSPRVLQSALITALVVATLFVAFSPNSFSGGFSDPFSTLLTAEPDSAIFTGTTQPNVKIGIVSGHMGNDSGAVCEDGTTEADVNFRIATIVQQKLNALGYETDLLKEKDPRLNNYHAAVLVSIHNDSCDYVNDQATGFKVAAAMSTRDTNLANRLEACLRERYQHITGLPLHESVTNDMTFYHAFNEIDPGTPAGIIETGFLNLDYDILTKRTNLVATGVADGIICFINNENIAPIATP
ncbi:MAG: N-acetylmuramoyl-L-alanine amidase [Chloroflexi bacterium]|nr:N-acetylmuramoyl-L-alanine amidase [Chloroflexota bacterium]